MSSIMGRIEPEHLELFALEFGKTAEYDFFYTLSSTNNDQSAPNLVKMYVTFDFVYTLSSAYIDHSALNLGKILMSNRIRMSLIMGPIGPEQLELFALDFGKIAAFDFVYSLTSTNINHSAPNLVTMNKGIRSQMNLIMGQVIPDQLVFTGLEKEKLNFSSLYGIYLHCLVLR